MSISSSEKIFIDPKEEITFIVERLLKSEKEMIILVVPLNSLLLSSLVSIDILFRKLVRTKKLAVIVTEDEYGKAIALKAGFIVVDKVSQITRDQWILANEKKQSFREILDERKKMLLENISGESVKIEDLPELPDIESEQFEINEEEIVESVEVEQPVIEEKFEEVVEPTNEVFHAQEIIKEDNDLEESLKKYHKPRREAKAIDLDGIKLISGGDVKSYIDSGENAKILGNKLEKDNMSDDVAIERKIKKVGSSSFTGKDFTKKVSSGGGLSSFFSKFSLKRRNPDFLDNNDFIKKKNRKRNLIIVGVSLIIFSLLGFYLLAFQFSSVDVLLTLRAQDVSTSASVLIRTDVTEVNLDSPITIPAVEYVIPVENLSISKTGTADGSSKRGAKAKGVVTVYNLRTQSVTLPAGTKFTNLTNNLTYVLLADIALDPATVSSNIKTPTSKDGVALEAESFGPQFNIDVVDKTRFSIAGFSTEEELSATAFQSFQGGTEESFTSVSQENFDKLKETVIPDLKKQGLERLKALTESGFQLIEQTVVYDESKLPESLPKLGEESKDKTFNLTVQMGVKGWAVRSEDLALAITTVLENNSQDESGNRLRVEDLSELSIDKVEKVESGYALTLSSSGSIRADVTIDQMKKDIAGLNMQQVNDYFRLIDYIQEYRVSFSPAFIPSSVQRVPSDTSRISIKTR